jgi:hypothetical protein
MRLAFCFTLLFSAQSFAATLPTQFVFYMGDDRALSDPSVLDPALQWVQGPLGCTLDSAAKPACSYRRLTKFDTEPVCVVTVTSCADASISKPCPGDLFYNGADNTCQNVPAGGFGGNSRIRDTN